MNAIKPEWLGTPQHRRASDLSRWLVHLTRSEDDLISILKTGVIEARLPFGAGRGYSLVRDRHYSVCLTETPLNALDRMTRKRPWGLVFDKERLRARYNAQPVWYVSDPSPQWTALQDAMSFAAHDTSAPIWALAPFVERVRGMSRVAPSDWRWEREWRIQGDFEFDLTDIAMIVVEDRGAPEFLADISVGLPWITSEDPKLQWFGGYTAAWNSEIEGMLERFRAQFLTVDEAGMPWDSEDQDYFPLVEIVETEDAMEEAFGFMARELHQSLALALNSISGLWCRTFDVARLAE